MTIEEAQDKAIEIANTEMERLLSESKTIIHNGITENIYCSTANTKTGKDGWLLFSGEIIDKK